MNRFAVWMRHAGLALTFVALLAMLAALSACASSEDKTVTLATVLPTSGADAAIGQAMQRAVDLAVKQNSSLGNGYTLTVTHYDEAGGAPDGAVATAASDAHVMGIVGPYDSQSAAAMLPGIKQYGIATITPGATLASLTPPNTDKPLTFFRIPPTDAVFGKAAADLAYAGTGSHGLGAQSVYIVDDNTASGKALAAAFTAEFRTKGGNVAGQRSLVLADFASAQTAVNAIVDAEPDIVFFAGGTVAAAQLRATLSLSGVPGMKMLVAGPAADNPGWADALGVAAAGANTTAILPAQDLSKLDSAKDFVAAYQAAYSGQALLPQAAQAYDAAMVEITAIKAALAGGKAPTRAAVLAAVAATQYTGATGAVAFDDLGNNTTSTPFAAYTSDSKAAWKYSTSVSEK